MLPNVKGSEALGLASVINPQATHGAAVTSGWVKVTSKMLALIAWGVLGASATVDGKLQQATTSTGTGAKDITGKAITQVTAGNNGQALINLDPQELDVEGGFAYIQLSITVGTADTPVAGAVIEVAPAQMPATQPAAVVQTVG